MKRTPRTDKRLEIREAYWPHEDFWTIENSSGYFSAPRTLPLLLKLLKDKKLSGSSDPSSVYLELFSRHMGEGVIEMGHEGDHAFAAGYSGTRAIRTWQERMKLLEELGFIKVKAIGNVPYKYVLLVHPTAVVIQLAATGRIDKEWFEAFRNRQMMFGDKSYQQRCPAPTDNVVPITTVSSTKTKAKRAK